jgi:ketosteroid isomerase-like protein
MRGINTEGSQKMKSVVVILVAAVAGLAVAMAQISNQKTDQGSQAEQELVKIERKIAELFMRRDATALEPLIADDFLSFNPVGTEITKAQVMAQLTSPDYEVESLQHEDNRVRVFGDAAVVTAITVVKGQYKGEDASGRFRYMRVWIKRQGRWQAVAAQSSILPE